MNNSSITLLAALALSISSNLAAAETDTQSSDLDLSVPAEQANVPIIETLNNTPNSLPLNPKAGLRFEYTGIDSDMRAQDERLSEVMQFRVKFVSLF